MTKVDDFVCAMTGCPELVATFTKLKAKKNELKAERAAQQQKSRMGQPLKRARAELVVSSDSDSDDEVLGDLAKRRKATKAAKMAKAAKAANRVHTQAKRAKKSAKQAKQADFFDIGRGNADHRARPSKRVRSKGSKSAGPKAKLAAKQKKQKLAAEKPQEPQHLRQAVVMFSVLFKQDLKLLTRHVLRKISQCTGPVEFDYSFSLVEEEIRTVCQYEPVRSLWLIREPYDSLLSHAAHVNAAYKKGFAKASGSSGSSTAKLPASPRGLR